MDLYRCKVVGRSLSGKPDAHLVVKALDPAYESLDQPRGVLFHSDQGCQYNSRLFRQRLWRYRFIQSMSRRGNCWDNAPMERLFRCLESQWIPKEGYTNTLEAEKEIGHYSMRYYNWQHPHSYNNGVSPGLAEKKRKTVSGIT